LYELLGNTRSTGFETEGRSEIIWSGYTSLVTYESNVSRRPGLQQHGNEAASGKLDDLPNWGIFPTGRQLLTGGEKPDSLISGSTTFHKAAPFRRGRFVCFYTGYACVSPGELPTLPLIASLSHCVSPMFSRLWYFLCRSLPVWLGLLAFLFVAISLDVTEEHAWTANGPGLTFDENLNVGSGVYVTESLLQSGLAVLDPRTLLEIFNSPAYFPDYPPLGRLPLGLSNAVLGRVLGLGEHPFYQIPYARVGSAVSFGLLALLLTWFTRRQAGTLAAIITGICCVLTPRLFGHAHLASVETMMNLAYAGCGVTCLECLSGKPALRARDGLWPGVVLGLALLTKIQAIFLPPVIVVWMLWYWKLQAVRPLVVLTITSTAVFFLGWPWLWSDPLVRFMAYFAQTTDRAVLYCYYFGERYVDRTVPWHYPFVIFVITTPLPWLLLGSWGMWLSRADGHENKHANKHTDRQKETESSAALGFSGGLTSQSNRLLLGLFWLPLCAFAIPGVPVYDGERLFLVVWPIFAIWTGIAGAGAVTWFQRKVHSPVCEIICGGVILIPLISMFTLRPVQLSFYGMQVGGLPGAKSLGMELNYWGDAVTPGFLERACRHLPQGSTLAIAPVLHPLIPQFLATDSWLEHRRDLRVVAYDDQSVEQPRYVLLIHRRADFWKSLLTPPPGTQVLEQVRRQGVVLAELLELPPRSPRGQFSPIP